MMIRCAHEVNHVWIAMVGWVGGVGIVVGVVVRDIDVARGGGQRWGQQL
jgi:Trk-type K+ transport system membrane component